MLMSLEFTVLALFGYLMSFLLMYDFEMYYCMFFFSYKSMRSFFILVMLIRSHGNNFLQSLNLLR